MLTVMDLKETVRRFIVSNYYVGDASALTDDTSLVDQAIIDSTGIFEVIVFLESKFGIKIADSDMLPDNLDSIAKIAAFVARKKSG